jgi:hypothetical protein
MYRASVERVAGARTAALALVAVLLLGLAGSPAAGQLWSTGISSEPLGDDLIGLAAGDQYDPHIEKGGDMFLVVWTDERTVVPGDNFEFPHYQDVYAARLDSDGNLLDATPIIISDDLGNQSNARASWNGTYWLVTWESRAPFGSYPSALAVRVDTSGNILDDPPIEVDPAPVGTIDFVASGSDGSNWVVLLAETYQSGMNTETVLAGIKIGSAGNRLATSHNIFHPSCCYFFSQGGDLAYANGIYLLVMTCIPDIYAHSGICGLRISPSLSNLDGYPFEIALSNQYLKEPNTASNGSGYFVGWDRYTTFPPSLTDPYAARVTTAGVSLDHPDGIELWGGVGSGDSRTPKVAWDGTNWIAAWTDDQGARVARIATDGTVLDPGGVSFPDLRVSDVTGLPGGVRLAWDGPEGAGELRDVHSAFVSSTFAAGPTTDVSGGAPSHYLADVVVAGGDSMLVFLSDVSGESRIMAQGYSDYTDGTKAEPILLDSGEGLSGPHIAYDGTRYMAVWASTPSNTIYARRFLADGTVLDDPPIAVMFGAEPDVAAVGGDFLVVGTNGNTTARRPYAVRVRGSDGSVLDGTPILLGQSFAKGPRVAGMLDRWLVTWERRAAYDSEEADVYAAFALADGTTPGEFGIATNQATSETHYAPAIGSNIGVALIVWEDDRTYPGDNWNIYGRRVLVTGDVFDDPDGLDIATGERNERRADVAWNGSNFQVVYEVSEVVDNFYDTKADIYGSRVTETGVVLAPSGFAIEESETQDVRPAVGGSGGTSLVVSSVFESDYPYASYRLQFAGLDDGTTGVPDGDVVASGDQLTLFGTYPNPARGGTSVSFHLRERAPVTLRVYDISGRLVREAVSDALPAGDHEVRWDGLNESGRSVATGVYLYSLSSESVVTGGKIAVLK